MPELAVVNGKVSVPGFAGSVTFTIVRVASFLLVNVQVTLSPAAIVTVAAGEVPVLVPPTQVMSVSVHPVVEPSVTVLEPSWLPVNVKTFWFGLVASAPFVSGVNGVVVPVPEAVNGKVSVPEFTGSVTFTIVSEALFLLVNVQVTLSPAAIVTVAAGEVPVLVPPTQVMSVSVHPVVEPSVTVLEPSWLPVNVKTFWFGLVASAAFVSSVNGDVVPVPEAVNGKVSVPEFTGSVTFTIVSEALFLLVNVQVTLSPAAIVTVAAGEVPVLVPPTQVMSVSVHPVVEPSVTVLEPSWLPVNVKTFWFGL